MATPKKRKGRDYVTGLLTGRNQKRRNKEGQIIEVFVPNIINKYPPLSSALGHPKLTTDEVMVREQLRHAAVRIDQRVFRKDKAEKRLLKQLKAANKQAKKSAGIDPNSQMNVTDPVFIHQRAM